MNAKLRISAAAATVIAALAGCGSEVPGGVAGNPAPTRRACPLGSAYPPGTHGAVDFIDSIWHDSVRYEYLPDARITAAQVGSVVTRIQCSMENYPDTHALPAHWANDTATALPVTTPVHAVMRYSPRCRLAAYVAGQPRLYAAVTHTRRGPVPRPCGR